MQFLSLPNASPADADVLILPVPYEGTVTYNKGTAKGPEAILRASAQLEFFEEDRRWCPAEHMKICVLPALRHKQDDAAETFHQTIYQQVSSLPSEALLIGLGGEHSITPEMVFARMPDGGTVVQIDAHADFRPSYHGSIYNHACPMYRLRQHGYSLIQVGIRSLHADEYTAMEADDGISTWYDRQLQKADQWAALLKQLSTISGPVWLTIDMDGFNPALVSGVGTPQPGGLSWHQGLDIVETLTANRQIQLQGVDLLEMIPDPACVSDMTVAKLVQKIISYWGHAGQYHTRPKDGSQIGVEDE